MELVVVINESKLSYGACFVLALDPCVGILDGGVQMGQERKQLPFRSGNEDTALMAAGRADVIGTESFAEGSVSHDLSGVISKARFKSVAFLDETGTLSFANSLFQSDLSIITSSTVSL